MKIVVFVASGCKGEVGTQIRHADIADFMLKQIEDTKYLREAPKISN